MTDIVIVDGAGALVPTCPHCGEAGDTVSTFSIVGALCRTCTIRWAVLHVGRLERDWTALQEDPTAWAEATAREVELAGYREVPCPD
jgi:hypothetical protein